MRLIVNLLIWLIGLIITLALSVYFLPNDEVQVSLTIGGIIYAVLFASTFPFFSVSTTGNMGVVLYDPLFDVLTEIPGGLRMKYLQESIYLIVDLRKEVGILKQEEDERYPSRNEVNLKAKWLVAISPQRGKLVAFSKYHKENAEQKFRARIIGFFNSYFRGHTDDQVVGGGTEGFGKAQEAFRKIFGGDDPHDPTNYDPLEEEYGVWTGTPELYDVDREQPLQDVLATKRKLQALSEAAKQLVADSGGTMSYSDAYKRAETADGSRQSESTDHNYNFSGLPEGIQTLIAGESLRGAEKGRKK